MKSKDRNESSSETPKDDASKELKRKQRIPKKGWNPPPFDAFAEADRSRPRNSGRPGGRPAGRPSNDKPAFGDRPKRTFSDKPAFGDRPKRTFSDKPAFGDRPKRTFNRDDSRRGPSDEPRRKFGRGGVPTEGTDSPFPPRKPSFSREGAGSSFDKPKRTGFGAPKPGTRKPFDGPKPGTRKPFDGPKRGGGDKPAYGDRPARKPARDSFKGYGPKGIRSRDDAPARGQRPETKAAVEEVRLNKYIAHSGVCARREADLLIDTGKVKVNGKVVTELGTKVKTTDKVMVNDMAIQFEPYKYVLMNKPKNTITTTSDDRGRKTVMDIIENEIGERLYPVGRLDRNTTGLLLLTNDGDLANRLTHPSYTVGKVYQAEINRVLTDSELDQLRKGIELEDGPARAYHVVRGLLDPYSIELAVHEGRNHLVRRMVEALGAEVMKLKRSEFAGLDLDDLRPGRWRFLKTREVNTLRTRVKLPELRK